MTTKHLWRALGAGVALLVVAGCGSGSSGSSSSAAGEETKNADQINTDALDALAKQPSVHLSIAATDTAGVVTKIEGDVTADSARLTNSDSSGATTLLVVGGKAFAKQGQGGSFVEVPAEVNTGLQALTKDKVVSCSRVEHGKLSKGPITMLNGRRVITLVDDGKYPGDTPGSTLVALDGPPLPLRGAISGAETPGGNAACGHTGGSTNGKLVADYSYPKSQVTITAPPVSSPQAV